MEATKDYPNLKPWKPGQSGNLNGRPVGTRQAFSAGFHRDLAEVSKPVGALCSQCNQKHEPDARLSRDGRARAGGAVSVSVAGRR